jgi:hypothetical protein
MVCRTAEFRKDLEGSSHGLDKVQSRHLPGETHETTKNSVRTVGIPAVIGNGRLKTASISRYPSGKSLPTNEN